jgi:hypothetical protein
MGCSASFENPIVYKSISRDWIGTLRKLPDTKTNESRAGVKNKMHAKFRANKLLVVDIKHKLSGQSIGVVQDGNWSYIKGSTVEIADFDNDLNKVNGGGIYYFKSYDTAFGYEMPKNYSGQYKKWFDNGQLKLDYVVNNGKEINGIYRQWYDDGQLYRKCTFKDGPVDGTYKEWNWYGLLTVEGSYSNALIRKLIELK